MDVPTSFDLNHEKLAGDPRFSNLASALRALSPIDSPAAFNRYCTEACRIWREQFPEGIGATSNKFAELRERVSQGDDIIATSWGGVIVTRHQPPSVEKFLVILRGGYLALEMHEQKDERIEVTEGAGLILWRCGDENFLTVEALAPEASFHFRPGMQHCLIGTEDILVFERSCDPKGMDQDLIFIYEPEAV